MAWFPASKDHQPLTWWNRRPMYLVAFIAIGALVSMVLTEVLRSSIGGQEVLIKLIFTYPQLVDNWYLWTVFTYVLVNRVNFWFVLNTLVFWFWYGEDVERYLGRKSFVKLLVVLTVSLPLVVSFMHLARMASLPLAGIDSVEFGVFVAFVTLYPGAEFFGIKLWILATIYVAIDVLQYLGQHNWPGLILLATSSGVGFGFVRYQQGRLRLPKFRFVRRPSNPKVRVAPPEQKRSKGSSAPNPNAPVTSDQVDAILDKINQRGFQSLTADEKQILERASEKLGRRKK